MDIVTFIEHTNPISLGSVFCFITKQDSLLLSHIFKKKFETFAAQSRVYSSYDSFLAMKAQLEMSFLGQTSAFWFTQDIISQDPELLVYLSTYAGPHMVGYALEQKARVHANEVIIEVPDDISYEQFIACFKALYPTSWHKALRCAQQLFKRTSTIPVQSGMVLMYYCMLIGSKSDAFLEEWLPILLNPEKSLFTLSSLLFAKKEQQFFRLWSLLAPDYSEPFWTTYWSEQFFRAALFVSFMHEQKIAQAKKVAYRLPFSFVQKDWKNSSVSALKQAHDHLSTIDWNIKNGLPAHFDYFYAHFFMQKL